MAGGDDDLPFRVELWDDKDGHIEEIIAMASELCDGSQGFRGRCEAQTRQAHKRFVRKHA
jgi:hypothetical protein